MAKEFCFQCGNKLGFLGKFKLSELELMHKESPSGMTSNDKVCDVCMQKLPKNKIYEKQKALEKEEKEKQKALEKEEKEKEKVAQHIADIELEKELLETEKNFRKRGAITYQDEYCAIVSRLGGKNGELVFANAFSKLTKEGYRLMVQDEGSSLNLGIGSAGLNSFYFFQKIEYITLRNDEK